MNAKVRRDLKELQRKVETLKPASAPGMRTNRTTRGVTRRPVESAGSGETTNSVPRWG